MENKTLNITAKDKLLYDYCRNSMSKLKQLCNCKIRKIGGICQMDYDDLYSIALDVLANSIKSYNPQISSNFEGFLSGNIDKRFRSYIRERNRFKRSGVPQEDTDGNRIYTHNVSMDASDDGCHSMSETIPSDYNLELEVIERVDGFKDTKIQIYLSRLSELQRKIIVLLSKGYIAEEIWGILRITKDEYYSNLKGIRAYENVKILY